MKFYRLPWSNILVTSMVMLIVVALVLVIFIEVEVINESHGTRSSQPPIDGTYSRFSAQPAYRAEIRATEINIAE